VRGATAEQCHPLWVSWLPRAIVTCEATSSARQSVLWSRFEAGMLPQYLPDVPPIGATQQSQRLTTMGPRCGGSVATEPEPPQYSQQ